MEGYIEKPAWAASVRISIAALLAVFLLLGMPLLVSAEERQVVINEIMWDGVEYIELYNPTNQDTFLNGWSLTRQQVNKEPQLILKFGELDLVAAGQYFLIEKNEQATTVSANFISSSLTLVNSGELISLLNERNEIVDQANQQGAWWAGDNTDEGIAMERTDVSISGAISSNWHSATTVNSGRQGTPGEQNSQPKINSPPLARIDGPSNVFINEEITLTAENSSDPDEDSLSYYWSLSDGSSYSSLEITPTFTNPGQFTINLTVADEHSEAEASHLVTVTTPSYSNDIVINEFLPNPDGPDTDGEFIELKNTGTETISLKGWQLDDGEGGSSPYIFEDEEVITGNQIKPYYRSDTAIALNNSGDTVRLINPGGNVQNSHSYSSSTEGSSINRTDNGNYQESTTITPGEPNRITDAREDDEDITDEESEESVSSLTSTGQVAGTTIKKIALKDIRKENKGDILTVTGKVSVPPGIYSDTTMYLSGSGIQLYFSKKQYPDIKLGDTIEVTGELSSFGNEARLKISQAENIKILNRGDPPSPHILSVTQIGEDYEGSLVTVQGHVTQTSGDTFYIGDEESEVKIFIKEATSIEKPKMNKGMAITVTGIVSETNSGYRILPRFQEDIRLGLVAGLTSFPATGLGRTHNQLTQVVNLISSNQYLTIGLLIIYLIKTAQRSKEPLLSF